MDDLEEIITEFLIEASEILDRLDDSFVQLEREGGSTEVLASIFRSVHTLKGTSGFLGFDRLQRVTHVGENLLAKLRDGHLQLTAEMTTALLTLVDAVREMLASIESAGNDGTNEYRALVEHLTRLATGEPAPPAGEGPAAASSAATPATPGEAAGGEAPGPSGPSGTDGETAASVQDHAPTAPTPAPTSPASPAPAPAASAAAAPAPAAPPTSGVAAADTTIRVDVNLLDRLMNLVGELVLARNQILQYASADADQGFVGTTQRLNLITSELQESVMKTRMQPIGSVWSKFPRVVRDLAMTCGKQVRVEMEGKETELDKTIIEAIKDPLTHIVRNSVDHGIERPDVREARGKPAEGCLSLRAFHEGGQVNIEIIDDGGGIDAERVRAKAIEKGMLTAEQAARLSDHDAVALIFAPGFSTAEQVTNVSGRGVGMDVVKTNIEKIGGTLDVQSRIGEGTTLKIKIPLTLAIIPALIVSTAGDHYAIPQVNLLELVRLESDQLDQLDRVGDAMFFRLRGRLLPVFDLREFLGLGSTQDITGTGGLTIVVLQADGHPIGLVVEDVNDTQEIVVKPLGRHLKGLGVYAGTTIMGDGNVALILDVIGIAQKKGALVESTRQVVLPGVDPAQRRGEVHVLLVCSVGGQRVAVPLALVARLEEIPAQDVERVGGRAVVQYHGKLMPLLHLVDYLGGERYEHELLNVVVYSTGGVTVGLVVDEIVDIVEEEKDPSEDSVMFSGGAGVIGRRATDLLDPHALLQSLEGSIFDRPMSEVR